MEPISVREWQMLVDAVDALRVSFDKFHEDMTIQKVATSNLESKLDSMEQRMTSSHESWRWRVAYLVVPVLIVFIAYVLPHFKWSN